MILFPKRNSHKVFNSIFVLYTIKKESTVYINIINNSQKHKNEWREKYEQYNFKHPMCDTKKAKI